MLFCNQHLLCSPESKIAAENLLSRLPSCSTNLIDSLRFLIVSDDIKGCWPLRTKTIKIPPLANGTFRGCGWMSVNYLNILNYTASPLNRTTWHTCVYAEIIFHKRCFCFIKSSKNCHVKQKTFFCCFKEYNEGFVRKEEQKETGWWPWSLYRDTPIPDRQKTAKGPLFVADEFLPQTPSTQEGKRCSKRAGLKGCLWFGVLIIWL